jgi:hypothetical protein
MSASTVVQCARLCVKGISTDRFTTFHKHIDMFTAFHEQKSSITCAAAATTAHSSIQQLPNKVCIAVIFLLCLFRKKEHHA